MSDKVINIKFRDQIRDQKRDISVKICLFFMR